MGANSRVRRAAKKRSRTAAGGARERHRGPGPPTAASLWIFGDPEADYRADDAGPQTYEQIDVTLRSGLDEIAAQRRDPTAVSALVEAVWNRLPAAPTMVHDVALDLAARTLGPVVDGGWGPSDLVELVSRAGAAWHLPALVTALHEEFRRNPTRGAGWQRSLAAHGDDPRLRFDSVERLSSALVLVALLLEAPLLHAEALADRFNATYADGSEDTDAAHPKLARVRALLAKAESTSFPEEAEALTAKAQELIARHSLDALVSPRRTGGRDTGLVTRRIWLDAPYLRAKSALVGAVASANHAVCAVSEQLGFCIVVGAGHDLDAIELLVTSLLLQADRAMLAHGQRSDGDGTSRTRSFRSSFLVAYAARIGARLAEAGAAVVAQEGDRFLPVLRRHDEEVREAFAALVPHRRGRALSISNGEGWVAGTAAADAAQLGVHDRLSDGAASPSW